MAMGSRIKYHRNAKGPEISVEAKGNYETRIFGVIEDAEKG